MYLLDIDEIKAGDIILVRSDSEISNLVRRLTNSNYSHAILYVGAGSCIESDGYGVQAQNIQRLLFKNVDDTKVLRLNDFVNKVDEIQNAIVFARQKIGTEYSISEAKISLMKKEIEAKEPNRQFCSRFVAQTYESAGIKLVDNADYCSPEDLLKSSLLKEVANALRQASEKEIEFGLSESPLKKQADIHNQIFWNARRISNSDIQTFEQLGKYVIENPDKEPEMTKIIEDSGYLTMWQIDIDQNPWHYDHMKLVEHYRDPRQIVEVAMFFATTESETRQRFELTLDTLKFGYSFFRQKYFKIQIDLYEKLIRLSRQREMTALTILKG